MDNLLEVLKIGFCFNREKRDVKRKISRVVGGKLLICGFIINIVI